MVQAGEAKAAEELARVMSVGRRRMKERSSGSGSEYGVDGARGPGNGKRAERDLNLLDFLMQEALTTRGDRRRDWPGPAWDKKALLVYLRKEKQRRLQIKWYERK